MLNQIGIAITEEENAALFTGVSLKTTSEIISKKFHHIVPTDFWQTYEERVIQELKTSVTTFPGVRDLVVTLGKNCCVASSGSYNKIFNSLTATNLLALFEGKIFSASEVSNGKPAPDLFLFAAQKMKVAPDRCAVIEDSIYGVQAAVSAGMQAFGFMPNTDSNMLADYGAVVFRDFEQLNDLLNLLSS